MNRPRWTLSGLSGRSIGRRRSAGNKSRNVTVESLEPRTLLAGDLSISEFQAINSTTLQDEDGDFEDWIEVRNAGNQPANLAGWFLTDDDTDLSKWQFPAVTIDAGSELIVFASNKDRTDPDGQLHTNFALDRDGEYLALVQPDGAVAHDFGDQYPPQVEDQSYGLAVGRDTVQLINNSDDVRATVPVDDGLGTSWIETGFNDEGWFAGNLGVGYEVLRPGVELRDDFDGPLDPAWTVDIPPEGVGTVSVVSDKLRINVPSAGQNTTADERGLAPLVYRELPGQGPADWELITHVTQRPTDRGAAGIGVVDANTGLLAVQLEYASLLTFRLSAGGESQGSRVSQNRDSYFLRLVRDGIAQTWTGYFKLAEADEWTLLGTAQDGIDGTPVVEQPLPTLYARTPTNAMRADFDFAQIIVPDQRPVYGPEIGLDLGNEMFNNNASAYLRVPFNIEGAADRFDEMTMTVRYDDGFRAFINGVMVTEQNVPIESTWESSASSTFGAVNGRIPSVTINLGASVDALQPGENVLAVHAMNVSSLDTDFFFDTQLLAAEVLDESQQFFIVPTPGDPNDLPAAPTPVILAQQGVFFGSRMVELQLEQINPSLEIRYTVDGTDPTPESLLYTAPFPLTESAMLQARTFDTSPEPAFDPSNAASGTFFAMSEELRGRDSDVPLVILDSLGQRLPNSGSTSLRPVNVVFYDVSEASGRSELDGIVEYLGRGGVRDRGSSTAGQPKPNMTFETWGADGTTEDDDTDVSIGGLPADSDWVLHAPFTFDRALIRNQFFMGLSHEIDVWASHTRVVEVYFNNRDGIVDESDYAGAYVLMEKVKRGKDRVDITEISPEDNDPNSEEISGGYIWKVDRTDPGEPAFSAGGQSINWVEPKSPRGRAEDSQKATPEQEDWVQAYFNDFRATLRDPDLHDPDGYSKFINVDSWVDQHLINVLTFNVDAFRLSAYFYKDRNETIEYGPLWDCDRCMESTDGRDDNPLVWSVSDGTNFFTYTWWRELFQDPNFWQVYIDRWQELRRNEYSDANIDVLLDSKADEVRESAERNSEKWRQSRPRTSSAYPSGELDGTYQGEVDHMRNWLHARADFMDNNFVLPVNFFVNGEVLGNEKGTRVQAGTEVAISAAPLTIFNDTTILSGEPGQTTATYFIPTDDSLGTDWAAPNFNDSQWESGPTGLGFDSGDDFLELIGTTTPKPDDVQDDATTILSRMRFQVADLDLVKSQDLVLRMKYDDGFVAYLNGIEVHQQNIRETPLAWDSRTTTHPDRDAVEFEDFDISEFSDLLIEGENVLAIRGINSTSGSNDMLILPELVSREVEFNINPNATVYYTTDGSDPRGPDGMPTPAAVVLPAGGTVRVDTNTRIISRSFDDLTDRGDQSSIVRTDWSGPRQYDFVVTKSDLAISELNYNPGEASAAEVAAGFGNDDFEFVEILNTGSQPADLIGVELTDGVEFDFINSAIPTLAAGERLVVVRDQAAFQMRYGNELPVAGVYEGSLDNDSEDVDLVEGTGEVIFSVNYADSDPWPVRADGFGATLELIDPPSVAREEQSKWYRWRGSTEVDGSPGIDGTGPVGVVVNEVLARTEAPVNLSDSIELHNTTAAGNLDIGGWGLSDSANDFYKFTIPANTTIPARGYLVFDETDFNPANPPEGASDFALNGRTGDDVWLVTADGAFVDDVHFRGTLNGESLGRVPNATGRLAPLERTSLGLPNTDPRVGPIVVTEIQYNPILSDAAIGIDPNLDASDLEFIEIHNPTASPVDLTDWRIRGGVDFNFADGDTLAAGETIVLMKFNPDDPENINQLNAFRAHYGISDAVRLMGGYSGQLSNSDDKVLLLRPDARVADEPNLVIRVQEDEVLYDDLAPWPRSADGTGHSLQRKSVDAFGNVGESWNATIPSPGSPDSTLVGDFNLDGVVDEVDINLLFQQMRSPNPDLSFDLTADGLVDEDDRDEMIENVLATDYGDSNLDGLFNSSDFVLVFQAGEYEDGIPLNSLWETGDWNGDGEFDTRDFVLAFQSGGYTPDVAALDARLLGAAFAQDAADVDPVSDAAVHLVLDRPLNRAVQLDLIEESLESLFEEDRRASDQTVEQIAVSLVESGLEEID